MMWLSRKKGQLNIRHDCDQGDPSIVYTWLRHDGSTFGEQEIVDTGEGWRTTPSVLVEPYPDYVDMYTHV